MHAEGVQLNNAFEELGSLIQSCRHHARRGHAARASSAWQAVHDPRAGARNRRGSRSAPSKAAAMRKAPGLMKKLSEKSGER